MLLFGMVQKGAEASVTQRYCYHASLLRNLLFCIMVASCNGNNEDATIGNFTFTDRQATLKLEPLQLSFSFETYSYYGRLLLLIISDKHSSSTVYEIAADIESRGLHVTVKDSDGHSIARTKSFLVDVSNQRRHTLRLLLVADNQTLEATLDNDNTQSLVLETAVQKQESQDASSVDVSTYFGSSGFGQVFAPIGCVSDIRVTIGGISADISEPDIQDGVVRRCLNVCKSPMFQCVSGRSDVCINHFTTPLCDCFLSEGEGRECSTRETSVVSLTGIEFVAYNSWRSAGNQMEQRQPRRLTAAFKMAATDAYEKQQLLIYTRLHSASGNLKSHLELTVSQKGLTLRALNSVELQNPERHLKPDTWHTVELHFHYNRQEIQVIVDNETSLVENWSTALVGSEPLDQVLLLDSEIFFGGTDVTDRNELAGNFVGCLRDLYVEYDSVLYLARANDDRIRYNERLTYSCPRNIPVIPPTSTVLQQQLLDPPSSSTHENIIPESISVDSEPHDVPGHTEPDPTPLPSGEEPPPPEARVHPSAEDTQSSSSTENKKLALAAPANSTLRLPQIFRLCSALNCQHKAPCVTNGKTGHAYCNCEGTGYKGTHCQFATFEKNCDELLRSGETRSGIYQIDPDGSGTTSPAYVWCHMNETEGHGYTFVDHNFKNGTLVRTAGSVDDIVYQISYRLMDDAGVLALQKSSEYCSQFLSYECQNAPLNWNKFTMLTSVQQSNTFGMLGSKSSSCSCGEQKTCVQRELSCNCNANTDQIQTDEGMLENEFSGLKTLTFLQHKDQNWARLSVGQLLCYGRAGHNQPIVFRRKANGIALPSWKGSQISFWFRTSESKALFFSQSSSAGHTFKAFVDKGHIVEFHMQLAVRTSDQSGNAEQFLQLKAHVVSQSPINDTAWHRLSVEESFREFNFRLDNSESFFTLPENASWSPNQFDQPLIIGGANIGEEKAFVGCMRSMTVDNESIDLDSVVKSTAAENGVESGCQDHCLQSPCKNNANCVEDFEANAYKCICKNHWAQSGKDCEIDINVGTEVSFRSSQKSLIKFERLSENPLTSDILLSFRTDQSDGLIYYAHDQFFNFVQLHLHDSTNLTLTLNNGNQISQCSIKHEPKFGTMNWVQVYVQHDSHYTVLYADDQACLINEPHKISEVYIKTWSSETSDIETVFPPKLPVPPLHSSTLEKYNVVYFGGLPKTRTLHYSSDISHLLGCLRGIRIGEAQLDPQTLLDNSIEVTKGCTTGCSLINCNPELGGHCTVQWESESGASCDCTLTSYLGPNCRDDLGVSFSGEAALRFNMEQIVSPISDSLMRNRQYDLLHFAFSTLHVAEHNQLLLFLKIFHDYSLELFLSATSNDLVVALSNAATEAKFEQTVYGNFSDGQRHFVMLKFKLDAPDLGIVIRVDRLPPVEISLQNRRISLEQVRFAMIGGPPQPSLSQEFTSYKGCISNLIMNVGADNTYEPITYYVRPDIDSPYSKHVYTVSQVGEDRAIPHAVCGQLATPPTAPPTTVTFPPWNEALVTLIYDRPTEVEIQEELPLTTIAVVAGIVLAVVILLLALYIYYLRCLRRRGDYRTQSKTPRKTESGKAEYQPLKNPETKEKVQLTEKEMDDKLRISNRGAPLSTHAEESEDKGLAEKGSTKMPLLNHEAEVDQYADDNAKRLSRDYPPPYPLHSKSPPPPVATKPVTASAPSSRSIDL